MENVGITQLYHEHATSIIRMHEQARTTTNISRAAIEEQILVELEAAALPPVLKIAWFAAILGGDHFAPFWVKTLERIPLTERQMERFEPDQALYDHNVPAPQPTAAAAPRARLFLHPPAPQAAPAAAAPAAAPRPRRNPARGARPGQHPPPAPQAAPAAALAAPNPRRNPQRRARPGQHPRSILRRRPQGQPTPRRAPRSVAFAPDVTVLLFR